MLPITGEASVPNTPSSDLTATSQSSASDKGNSEKPMGIMVRRRENAYVSIAYTQAMVGFRARLTYDICTAQLFLKDELFQIMNMFQGQKMSD